MTTADQPDVRADLATPSNHLRPDVLKVSARGLEVGMRVKENASGKIYRVARITGDDAWLEPTINANRRARRAADAGRRKGGA